MNAKSANQASEFSSNSLQNSSKRSLALSLYTFISRILGLIRDHYMAVTFGTGMIASAFSVAYRLPNMFRNFLAEGTLSQSFMPLFSESSKEGDEAAKVMAGSVLSFLFFVLSLLVGIFFLTSHSFIPLVVGGTKEYSDLIIELSYILFFLIMTASLSSIFMAIANAKKKYFIPSLSPIILNLSYILAIVFVFPFLNGLLIKINVLSYFIISGGVIQLLVQAFYVYRLGYFPQFNLNWKHPAIKKIFKLMIPAVIGGGFYQISLLVDIFLANYVQNKYPGLGAVVSLDYAQRLVQLPTGIIGVALATTILPELLSALKEEKHHEIAPELLSALSFALYLTLPAMFGLMIMGRTVLDAIYYGGKWNHLATVIAMSPLFYYTIAIPFYSMNKVLTSSFYAFQDTATPLRINSIAFSFNIVINLILIQFLRHEAIAMASLSSAIITFVMLYSKLKRHSIIVKFTELFDKFRRMILPLLALIFWCVFIEEFVYEYIIGLAKNSFDHATISRLILLVGIFPAIALYFKVSHVIKVEEFIIIKDKFLSRRKK